MKKGGGAGKLSFFSTFVQILGGKRDPLLFALGEGRTSFYCFAVPWSGPKKGFVPTLRKEKKKRRAG